MDRRAAFMVECTGDLGVGLGVEVEVLPKSFLDVQSHPNFVGERG